MWLDVSASGLLSTLAGSLIGWLMTRRTPRTDRKKEQPVRPLPACLYIPAPDDEKMTAEEMRSINRGLLHRSIQMHDRSGRRRPFWAEPMNNAAPAGPLQHIEPALIDNAQ